MQIDITIKNYRRFTDRYPTQLCLKNGIISLIGVNNSGKSSLLRFFYEMRGLFNCLSDPQNIRVNTNESLLNVTLPDTGPNLGNIFSNSNDRHITLEVKISGDELSIPDSVVKQLENIEIHIARDTQQFKAVIPNFHELVNQFPNDNRRNNLNNMVMSSAFTKLANSFYVGPFRNTINIGSHDNYFDLKIGESFIVQWKEWQTGRNTAHHELCYRVVNDIKNIFGYKDLQIYSAQDNLSIQTVINGRSYRLHELGAGISQFFLVLASAAINNPSYILIDEPELNLHPSLQLDFLTSLASYARDGVIFATHSVGLARTSSDEIYSVVQTDEWESRVMPFNSAPRMTELLGELSFSTWKEIGCEKILLVEGRTEVKTMQQFLRKLRKDHQIVIIPMGGGEIINEYSKDEILELTRIVNSISAIIDSEKSSFGDQLSRKREAFKRNCDDVGINCYVTKWRATENYFTDRAIKKVVGNECHALRPYERLGSSGRGWNKNQNWLIAMEMSTEELLATDLGKYLQSI